MAKTTTANKEIVKDLNPGVTIKNFKNSNDVENFYRFIHENKLRAEAQKLVEVVLKHITPVKKRGRKKVLH